MTLKGVAGVAVRDLTDITHPITRCIFSGGQFFRFISATRVSYVMFGSIPNSGPQTGWQGAPGALYVADLVTGNTALERTWKYTTYLSWEYAWSPDGSALTYIDTNFSDGTMELDLISAAGDRTLAKSTITTLGAAACWPGFQSFGDGVGFSADGKYVSLLTYQQFQVVRVSDGISVFAQLANTSPAVSSWSMWAPVGDQLLHFTNDANSAVRGWDPVRGDQPLIAATEWATPWASSDGVHVVFARRGSSTDPAAWATDWTPWIGNYGSLSASAHRLVDQPRYGTTFLTPTLIWYAEPVHNANGCIARGRSYIYDLSDSTETPSIITGVFDSWPHFAGQS